MYGHSRGVPMVSEDKKTWDERPSIALVDLAVSPDEPDTVLATTEQGLAVSGDGGNRFQVVKGAPVMVLITWTDEGRRRRHLHDALPGRVARVRDAPGVRLS